LVGPCGSSVSDGGGDISIKKGRKISVPFGVSMGVKAMIAFEA